MWEEIQNASPAASFSMSMNLFDGAGMTLPAHILELIIISLNRLSVSSVFLFFSLQFIYFQILEGLPRLPENGECAV
jgi:hypothetical protein